MRLLVNHTPGKFTLLLLIFGHSSFISIVQIRKKNELSIQRQELHFRSNLFFHR